MVNSPTTFMLENIPKHPDINPEKQLSTHTDTQPIRYIFRCINIHLATQLNNHASINTPSPPNVPTLIKTQLADTHSVIQKKHPPMRLANHLHSRSHTHTHTHTKI